MRTRIDHATVVTCRHGETIVLTDTSVTFDGGVIITVEPTIQATRPPMPPPSDLEPGELKGRPLGAILIRLGRLSEQILLTALDRQKTTHGVIGQTLVEMGAVTHGEIEQVLDLQAGREPTAQEPDTIIDAHARLVIPGLVNTHHHLFQSLTRCMPAVQNANLFDWLVGLYPVWRELTYDALRQAAAVSIAELLLGGATTTSDHMYLFPAERDVKIEAVLEAAHLMGIRIHACRGSMTMGESAGGLPPDACVERDEAVLADSVRAIESFHDASPMSMRRVDLAPCAPFNVTPELLNQTRELAVERNVLLHTHVAETLDEQRFCLERYGVRPLEYLRQRDWLGPNVYLAHCVQLDAAEIALLAETSTGVAHCPCSNMRLGSGIAPIRDMLDAGVRVGVAVDGSSSNDGGSLLAEARQALLLQRVARGADGFSAAEAFHLATTGGASVLNRPELGRIEAGAAADLVIYDANDVAFAGALAQDPLGALMFCHAPRPEQVIVAGQTVVEDGRIKRVDLPEMVADFNQMVRGTFRTRAS